MASIPRPPGCVCVRAGVRLLLTDGRGSWFDGGILLRLDARTGRSVFVLAPADGQHCPALRARVAKRQCRHRQMGLGRLVIWTPSALSSSVRELHVDDSRALCMDTPMSVPIDGGPSLPGRPRWWWWPCGKPAVDQNGTGAEEGHTHRTSTALRGTTSLKAQTLADTVPCSYARTQAAHRDAPHFHQRACC